MSALSSAWTQAAAPWVSLALSPLLSVVSYSDGEKVIFHLPHAVDSQVQPLQAVLQSSFPALCGIQLYQMQNRNGRITCGFFCLWSRLHPFPLLLEAVSFSRSPSMVLFHRSAIWSAWVTALWTPSSLWFLKCAFKFACNQIPTIVLWSFSTKVSQWGIFLP